MAMTISGTGASAPEVAANDRAVLTARKALNQQQVQGEQAVRLIDEAGKVATPPDPKRGRHVDVIA